LEIQFVGGLITLILATAQKRVKVRRRIPEQAVRSGAAQNVTESGQRDS